MEFVWRDGEGAGSEIYRTYLRTSAEGKPVKAKRMVYSIKVAVAVVLGVVADVVGGCLSD